MDRALVKNAADKEQVKSARKKETSRRDNELLDVEHMLASFNGRRFMWRFLQMCGMFETSFSQSTNQTFFNEGQRNIGLKLMSDINEANPDAYMTMMKESKGEKYV